MKSIWNKVKIYPFITILLVTINCVLFLLCRFWGEYLYSEGYLGIQGILVEQEYARFLYSMFLHADLEHLFNNMILLMFMGSMLEKIVGHVPYMILYFASGLGGGAFSLLVKVMQEDWSVSIGASGAIFGLDGLLLAVVFLLRDQVRDITPTRVGLMIILSIYNGYIGSNIDNAAHIGGLIVGFVTGLIICGIIRAKDPRKKFRIV